jgi:hypothetical protein
VTSRRRLRRNACTGKVAYHKLGEALAAVASLRRAGRGTYDAYACPVRSGARHFHVGHSINALRAIIPRKRSS